MTCNKITIANASVCVGDMKNRIEIYVRGLTPSVDNSVDFSEGFTLLATVWAGIKINSGISLFDNSNLISKSEVSHQFFIRYRSDITQENYIKFDGNYFDIVSVQPASTEKRILIINAKLRGQASNAVNQI